jgi:excinuclease ABC subunit C
MSGPDSPDRFNESGATYSVKGAGQPDLVGGAEAIRNVWKTLPTKPGVYRMHDVRGDVLYVGKAIICRLIGCPIGCGGWFRKPGR